MRLPEEKIKEAIVHPDKFARQEALNHFADCYSRDPEIMPLVIKAIETYGRADTFFYTAFLGNLVQSEATVEWAIRELNDETVDENLNDYLGDLSRLLCEADPSLLLPHEEAVLGSPGFKEDRHAQFREQLRLSKWDADRCWQEFEGMSADGSDGTYVELDHGSYVVKALARHGDKFKDRILELLGRDFNESDNDPMFGKEEFLVELAGEMRLHEAVPLIVKKLRDDFDDLMSLVSVHALLRIGGDEVVEDVTKDWQNLDWRSMFDAASILGRVHSDAAVKKCLELMPQTKDRGINTLLADALLTQCSDEGIEFARKLIQRKEYEKRNVNLPRRLIGISALMGVTFPEYSDWKRDVENEQAEREKKLKEWQQMNRIFATTRQEPKTQSYEPPEPIVRTQAQVGRNDPCPCGSGKKYKKCCLK